MRAIAATGRAEMRHRRLRFLLGNEARFLRAAAALIVSLGFDASGANNVNAQAGTQPLVLTTTFEEAGPMWLIVGSRRFAVSLDDNATVRGFAQLLPATFDLIELNGNEKYVTLPHALPINAVRPGTIRAGDVMLYGSDTLVVFYETFTSSYSYTRMGRVTGAEDLARALGPGNVRVTFAGPESRDGNGGEHDERR
jgi:hypothetical protein